jgi:pimeloyl-ACP methyl ester carboxylesterase
MPDVRIESGRNLRVHEAGDRDGVPVVVHHGTPSTGRLFRPHVEDARSQGIRLIGHDRPGYGGSTLQRDQAIAETAADVAAIADALGLDQFVTWGISGGGPHALACGAHMPDRVKAVASLAANAPIDAAGLDWTAGLGEANLESFEAMRRGRDAHEEYLRNDAEQLQAADANELKEHLQSLLTPVDRTALTLELTEYFTSAGEMRCERVSTAGVRTSVRPTGPGVSASTTSASRFCSGTAGTTLLSHLRTANGSPSTYRVLMLDYPTRMGT